MPTEKPIITNPAKDKLKRHEPVVGLAVFESLSPSIYKIVAQIGYDIILVDTEHVVHNFETLTHFLTGARDNGLTPIVSVISPDRALVSRMLDAGALGIVLSHADTPEQVSDLIRWVKYPPEGKRGLSMGASAGYVHADPNRYCREANESTLVILKIESRMGVENAEAMISIEGVDGIVFGPGDLAADIGVHGEWEHPEVKKMMEQVIDLAIAKDIAVEPFVMPDRDGYRRETDRGCLIFGAMRTTEYALFREAALNAIRPYRESS